VIPLAINTASATNKMIWIYDGSATIVGTAVYARAPHKMAVVLSTIGYCMESGV